MLYCIMAIFKHSAAFAFNIDQHDFFIKYQMK